MHIIDTVEMVLVPKKVKKVVLELDLEQIKLLNQAVQSEMDVKQNLGAMTQNLSNLLSILVEAKSFFTRRGISTCTTCGNRDGRHFSTCNNQIDN